MIYVLTYNYPHRKTQDLLLKLKLSGYKEIIVLSIPWQRRDNFIPLVPHRFLHAENIYPKELCNNLNINYKELQSYEEVPSLNTNDWILIGGAGIIPKYLTDTKKIINSHPAYLPYVRGLDALKWAIYEQVPIGVTTHIISDDIDLGFLIKRKMLPLYSWDTFHSVAWRQYELELHMLVSSIEDLHKTPHTPIETLEEIQLPIPKKRMSHRKEVKMLKKFDKMIFNIHDD